MKTNEPTLRELRDALPELPFDESGPVFRAPWEAQAFAMTLALYERGIFTWNEWARTLSEAIRDAQAAGDPDHGDTYYAHWLVALERISAAKGCVSDSALAHRREEWDEAARRTPHGAPIELRHALPDALIRTYEAAVYRIDGTPTVEMKIGSANAGVVTLLARFDVTSAVFVTAFNPFGHRLNAEENAARQRLLIAHVERSGLKAIAGVGFDPNDESIAEASLFVLGANREFADTLLKTFEQNAVVYVDEDGVPGLVWHAVYG